MSFLNELLADHRVCEDIGSTHEFCSYVGSIDDSKVSLSLFRVHSRYIMSFTTNSCVAFIAIAFGSTMLGLYRKGILSVV